MKTIEKGQPKITVYPLKPQLTFDDLDVYLPRGINALAKVDANPRGFFRIFQRHEGARFFGLQEFLAALTSLMEPDDIAQTIVYAVPEGYALSKHETAMTIEGPARALMVVETMLHYLSTGTRFRTLAATFPAEEYSWAFMGARYLAVEDLAIATRALAEEGILSTTKRWADRYLGTESHSQIAMWGGLRLDDEVEAAIASETSDVRVAATIRATVAFHRANPEVPLYVLGDFAARSVGCFEVFRATAAACAKLGIVLVGGRMDISKADLNDVPIVDREYINWNGEQFAGTHIDPARAHVDPGMSTRIVWITRGLLNSAGLTDFKLVVSSGIKLEEIEWYVEAGASIVGIGEEAAYFLNKGECNYTSDAIGYFENDDFVSFAKEGREIERIASKDILTNAKSGFSISDKLIRLNLADYL